MRPRAGILSFLALAAACGPTPAAGPAEVAWDRDTCAHCQMTLSDRFHAAQIRLEGDRDVQAFDDLGCALLWLADAGIEDEGYGLFVRTPQGDGWVDGRAARYEAGRHTPMGYGFGPAEVGLTLEEVRRRVRAREDERRSDPHEAHGH